MKNKNKPLTKRQKEVLDFINLYIQEHEYSPSLRDIAGFLGTTNPSSAQYFVDELRTKRYLGKKNNKTRGITSKFTPKKIPLLGLIAAGEPIEPIENPKFITIPSSFKIKPGKSYYALKVVGDSMMDMGILDDDTILVEHTFTAHNNDTVVAITEQGATLKVLRKSGSDIWLEPRNDSHSKIVPNQLDIRGKFIGLVRTK